MLSDKCELLFDFYEIAQSNGFFSEGINETVAWFDMFYRPAKELGGFCVMSGVQQFADYIRNLRFDEDDLAYLKTRGIDDDFLDYLRRFHFSCDIWAVEEGTPIFANEPVVKVRGPVIQAQMLETIILLCVNHQSLIATKANRIVRAAQGREVIEFGTAFPLPRAAPEAPISAAPAPQRTSARQRTTACRSSAP